MNSPSGDYRTIQTFHQRNYTEKTDFGSQGTICYQPQKERTTNNTQVLAKNNIGNREKEANDNLGKVASLQSLCIVLLLLILLLFRSNHVINMYLPTRV